MLVGYTANIGETPPNKRHTGSASDVDLNCNQLVEGAASMKRNCCPSVEVAEQSMMAVSTVTTERENVVADMLTMTIHYCIQC